VSVALRSWCQFPKGARSARQTNHPIGMPNNLRYAVATALEAERNASLCSFDCDTGGTASQPRQPNGNLLLLGSFRGQPETCLGLSVF
jgi:hypothetical protein